LANSEEIWLRALRGEAIGSDALDSAHKAQRLRAALLQELAVQARAPSATAAEADAFMAGVQARAASAQKPAVWRWPRRASTTAWALAASAVLAVVVLWPLVTPPSAKSASLWRGAALHKQVWSPTPQRLATSLIQELTAEGATLRQSYYRADGQVLLQLTVPQSAQLAVAEVLARYELSLPPGGADLHLRVQPAP